MPANGREIFRLIKGGYYEAEEKIFRRSDEVAKVDSHILRSTIHKYCMGLNHFLSPEVIWCFKSKIS